MGEKNYEVIQIDDATWSIENGMVRFFLLAGCEKAILIDSGLNIEGVKDLAKKILQEAGLFPDKAPEIELLNTHGDGDHCFGNREFDWFYMHPGDMEHYRRQFGDTGEIRPVKEGDVIDPGERPLEIIEIPGHTFGSIAVLDVKRRALYAGDSVQTGSIFLFGDHRDLDAFPAALLKLDGMTDRFDKIYASHDRLELEPDAVGGVFDDCEALFHGELEPEEVTIFDHTIKAYHGNTATFLVDPDRVFEGGSDED